MSYTRYAIYYLPSAGPLAQFGAAWLGWDVDAGAPVPQPEIDGIAEVTATPQKYGFHATLKPPFRLAEGRDVPRLVDAVADLARRTAPARCDGLKLTALGRFLALTPVGDQSTIGQVAGACVTELDGFRAPASEAELEKRRASGLSAAQDAMLVKWGYPYVLDQFRFHMTLTSRLERDTIAHWKEAVGSVLPTLPQPFLLDAISVAGERDDGRFELISRHVLEG